MSDSTLNQANTTEPEEILKLAGSRDPARKHLY
jgi:hypothetical protein